MSAFREGPMAALSRDRRRLRLIHGPIDLILAAEGPARAVEEAYRRAADCFGPVLPGLAEELPRLRAPKGPPPRGPVARRMQAAVAPYAPLFITPMAAVAGSVADHVLSCVLVAGHGLTRLTVNNGGDIALWQAEGQTTVAICEDPSTGVGAGRAVIRAGSGIGGVATSGWRGRSHSLGIADAVTVLARTAAAADAAATLIANAVDLPGHSAIARVPACTLQPDSDLGRRPVTTGVGPLSAAEASRALAPGLVAALEFQARGLIVTAHLALAGERCIVGETPKETLDA